MSNLQDITHLHNFHLGNIGRSDSAPAILPSTQTQTQSTLSRTKTPSSGSKKSQSGHPNLLKHAFDTSSSLKPNLPRLFSAFTGGMNKNWTNAYEAIGH